MYFSLRMCISFSFNSRQTYSSLMQFAFGLVAFHFEIAVILLEAVQVFPVQNFLRKEDVQFCDVFESSPIFNIRFILSCTSDLSTDKTNLV